MKVKCNHEIEKYCPSCKQVLPRECFGANRRRWDGLTSYCRDCCNAMNRISHAKHKLKVNMERRERYAARHVPKHKECHFTDGVCIQCENEKRRENYKANKKYYLNIGIAHSASFAKP